MGRPSPRRSPRAPQKRFDWPAESLSSEHSQRSKYLYSALIRVTCELPILRTVIRSRIVSVAALVLLVALGATAAASAASTRLPLNVVSLNDPTIGAHRFLGRTPIQVTSSFGKPSARTATRTTATLRYGNWTISFKKRASDGKLIGYAARANGGTLQGVHGNRLLAPSYSRAHIAHAVTAEIGWVENGDFNEWIPRGASSYVGADFPRTLSWGIDGHGVRWLKIETDLNLEFRGPSR